VNHKLK